jgi:hypothetical protein
MKKEQLPDLQNRLEVYRRAMQDGVLPDAYRTIVVAMMEIRSHCARKLPVNSVSGSLYQGYMDMTFFSVVPESLRLLKLKIVVVFLHDKFSLEIWLAGTNRKVQTRYCELFSKITDCPYRISKPEPGVDSILEFDLDLNPDFSNQSTLTIKVEEGLSSFISDVKLLLRV